MGLLWWILGIAVIVLWIFSLVDIIRKWRTRSWVQSVAWILLVLVIPLVGTFLYVMLNTRVGSPTVEGSFDYEKGVADKLYDQKSGEPPRV